MKNNQNNKSEQPLNKKAGEPLTENNLGVEDEKAQDIVDGTEEKKEASDFQRKPQFRLSENSRKRF